MGNSLKLTHMDIHMHENASVNLSNSKIGRIPCTAVKIRQRLLSLVQNPSCQLSKKLCKPTCYLDNRQVVTW